MQNTMKLKFLPRLEGGEVRGKSNVQKSQFWSIWKLFAYNQPLTVLCIMLALEA